MVVAGAGTGKTRVIAEKMRHLIDAEETPKEILAVTFTEKAASEMLARVDDIMPLSYEEPWIYTFHSFADRILRAEGVEMGLDTSYKILPYAEQWLLLRKNLFKFNLSYFRPLGNPTKFISAILKFISRLQDEAILPEDFTKFVRKTNTLEEKARWEELADIYEKYTQLKLEQSAMDFGDLLIWLIKLFEARSHILEKYQKQFKHVLVDEFQDTNYAQYEIIKLLCPSKSLKNRSLLVVGDDSQSIYKFRGAAISNILEFMKDFPSAEMFTLTENYRSSQIILDSAYNVVCNNNPDTLEVKLGISKKLEAQDKKLKKTKIVPKAVVLPTLEDEVEFVILEILNILAKEPEFTYKDFAVLARANSHLDPFVLALRKYGLPYQLVGNRGLYDRDEVLDILAFLRVIINPLDVINLYRVLNIDALGVPQDEIFKLLSQARYKKTDLWNVVKESLNEKVKDLCSKISYFSDKIVKSTPVELIYELVNSINYVAQFMQEETVENNLCINNLDLFLEKAKRFEVEFRGDNKTPPTLIDFVDFLDLMIEAGDNPAQAEIEDIDTINLLTVHASKGLEFPVVFLVNLTSDRFPTRNRSDVIDVPDELIKETLPLGDAHIQEERRLFYVGMTRAKQYLYLTLGKDYGGRREKIPSGFIAETELALEALESVKKAESSQQKSLFAVGTGFREPALKKITNFVPEFLSYTQVSTYTTCPLKYKYAYILKIPTPPSHALSFGITIHDTLRDFHTKLMFGEVGLEELLNIYEKNWQPLGYMDEEHRKLQFKKGKEILKEYYASVDRSLKPAGVEKSFNIKIDGIKFFGRIDRIDPLEDGVEIIDYKTGSAKTQKEVDTDDQVAFYAIAAKEALGLNPTKLTYYFVESGEKVSTRRTVRDLENTKQKVKEIIDKIKSGDFEATPGMLCNWCDYKSICPFVWKG